MTPRTRTALTAALLACPALAYQADTSPQSVVRPPQVRGVGAVHVSGQTFLTWGEQAALSGESYRIYRSFGPFADVRDPRVTDLGQETFEDSGELFTDRVWDDRPCESAAPDCGRPNKPLPCFRPRYVERHWIPDGAGGAREVAAGEGLLVWTPGADEFPPTARTSGTWVWYAVTTVDAYGNENTRVTSENRVRVFEQVDEPLPVEVPRAWLDCSKPGYCPYDNLGDRNPIPVGVHVFLQYMDLSEWNATYHAPSSINCWWGEDPTARRIRNNRQYAYAYTVHEPDPSLGPVLGPLTPVVVDLHQHADDGLDQAWGAGGSAAYAVGGRAIKIAPIDVGDTWWYGFSQDFDYRRPFEGCLPLQSPCESAAGPFPPPAPYHRVPTSGAVVNFTEQRVLRMVYDLARKPLSGYTPDLERVFVQGTSMGGAGALQLATRFPNVFAAAACAKPMTDYEDYLTGVPPKPERDLRYELPHRWGAWPAFAVTTGLPLLTIENVGPGDWADHLAPWNGTVVWDWMDQVEQMQSPFRRALGSAPFGVVSGFKDETLPYPTQGLPYFSAARTFGLSWGGKISCGGHGGPAHAGMPASLTSSATNPTPGPFSDYAIRRDETVPGFANLDLGAFPPPPTSCCNSCSAPGPYYYHDDLIWSSSWFDWDRPPVDKKKRWEMSVKWTGSFFPQPKVDVYPQRCSKFQVVPGATYQWANIEIGTGRIVQIPSAPLVAPAAAPLLCLEDVELTPPGNRIVLLRVN